LVQNVILGNRKIPVTGSELRLLN